MEQRQILQNAVRDTRTKKVYVSAHVHNCVVFTIAGKECMIDGGNEYFRYGGSTLDLIDSGRLDDISCYVDSPIEELMAKLVWGTYGKKNHRGVLTYVRLCDCDVEHLQNILATQHKISDIYKNVISAILAQKLHHESMEACKLWFNLTVRYNA